MCQSTGPKAVHDLDKSVSSALCTSSFEERKRENSIIGIERVTSALIIFSFIRVLVINKQLGTTLPFPSSSFPLMTCARFSLTTHFLASTRSASLLMMLSLRCTFTTNDDEDDDDMGVGSGSPQFGQPQMKIKLNLTWMCYSHPLLWEWVHQRE